MSLAWKDGKLTEATLLSKAGEPCTVHYGNRKLSFKTKKGGTYRVTANGDRLTVK